MPNTSSTGKFITHLATQSLYGDDLRRFLQSWVVGITGLDEKLVRPRWQSEPPNIPAEGVDWCSIGVVGYEDKFGRTQIEQTDTNQKIVGQEAISIIASFYGPQSDYYAAIFIEGSLISQNREEMARHGMNIVGPAKKIQASELIKQRWLRRIDCHFEINRTIEAVYPIMAIKTADIALNNMTTIVEENAV